MSILNDNLVAYGAKGSSVNVPEKPIVMSRDPLTTDIAEEGRAWVNKSTGAAFILGKVSGSPKTATWKSIAGGAGTFTTITTTGAATIGGDVGAATATITGNATVGGTLGVTGNTTLGGTLDVTGNIATAAGDIGAATATITGNATVGGTLDITGAATANDTLRSVGAFTAAGGLFSAADSGTGVASQIEYTNASDLTANGAGTFTIKSKSANNLDSSGFIKIWIGTTAYYVPVFTAVAP